jgi:hypothetical protein
MFKNLPRIVFVSMIMTIFFHIWAPLVISTAAAELSSETSSRLIRPEELTSFSAQELRFLRNEIYARHGYVFNDPNLQNYFSSQPWYRPLGNNRLAVAALSPV